ncbi:DUF2177 family protein [Rhizobium sp. EC-SD404]|uniref:DUF2177 family protein n=1 Tax=Rhizobium sp. EC-SD404 TaxID=2038389 RepID=UPI00125A8959|nr:DUF2177 family protein [Rhizobium sp. EC-SD404]VVT24029.1 conserved membrane hypothetical protein [Rhizobium sp. EC-SD404]
MKFVWVYLVAAVVFLAIDAIWLGYVARDFYKDRLGSLLLDRPRFGIAAGFYAIFVIGLIYFAIAPGLNAGSFWLTVFNAGLFGMFCYMTYDATNLSTIRGFDTTVAIVDTLWGTALSAFTAGVTYFIARTFSLWHG